MTSRPGQTITFNEVGKVSKIVAGSVTQDTVYNVDGSILLRSNDCQQSSWSADAWDLGSGRLSLKLFLDFSVDPDDVPDEKIYWLDKVK